MEAIWEIIAPYVAAIGGAGGVSVIVYVVVKALVEKMFNKNKATIDAILSKFDINDFANRIAEKLAGKTLNIDVTAVTEKALKKLTKELDIKTDKIEKTANDQKHMLVLVGNAVSKFKALSEDERADIIDTAKALENGYMPPDENEVMTVLLEPVMLSENENGIISDDTKTEVIDGVNFEGLHK